MRNLAIFTENRPTNIVMSLTIIVLLAYIGLCVIVYIAQRRLLYFPTPEVEVTGANAFHFKKEEEILKLWVVNPGQSEAIIYLGGNAEDVAMNIPAFSSTFLSHTVYLLNYRGYGGSTGAPSEKHLFKDALSIYDYLITKHSSVSVIGRSLGSGVAVYLAAERTPEKLILVTPFDSIKNIAQKQFPVFPVSLLLKDKYDSLSRAQKIQSPVLVVLAEFDEVVPRRHSKKLVSAFTQSEVELEVLVKETHNFSSDLPNYLGFLREFILN